VIFFHETLRAFLLDILSLFKIRCVSVLSILIRNNIEEKSHFLKKKIRLIYWGFDNERFYPRSAEEKAELRRNFGLPAGKRIIGFIGRYDIWKGHHTYIEACRRLLERRSDIFMLVVGGAMTERVVPAVGEYRREIQAQMKEFVDRGELFVWDHRDDIPEIMSVLDVFVCPSDREPFGLVVLEAVACGIPTVVSDGVGALESVRGMKGVFEAKAKDDVSFSEAIEEALAFDPAGMDIKMMNERFSWERHVNEYEKLYFEVFRGK
jgi:glycosyltransferase involved in cell wall biosynthesis